MLRQGLVSAAEVPGMESEQVLDIQGVSHTDLPPLVQQRSVFTEGENPSRIGQAYRPVGNSDDKWKIENQQHMEEAENLDMNAQIHGNWTIENAKSKLHQFMQVNKINTDYKYSVVGPDHVR